MPEVRVEIPVEVVHADSQEALHQFGRRLSVPITAQHVPNDLKSPSRFDKVEHERRLEIGVEDLLGVGGLDEPRVELAHG